MNFFELVTSSNLVAYWIEKDLNDVKVGDQLFPFKKEIGVELDWIKGANNQVVGLKLSAYDSKSIRRDRQGIEKVKTEMPFFKESMVVDEKMRQSLNTLLQTQNEALIRTIIAKIFDDEVKLIKAAYETVERVRMQLLTTGTITLASNGQSYTYDYGMPAENKITVTTGWADENADPVKDITDAQKVARRKGHKLTRAMCNTNCLNTLLNNVNIKNTLYVFAQGKISITIEDVRKYIEERTGITIYVNDNGYVAENGTFTNYFADDIFVLMPAEPLGETHFGTTPEESDLMSGTTDAEVSLVNNSVAVTTSKQVDPVNVETKVSMVMLPSFEQADAVFILDVDPTTL
jgi:hypothetical protein